MILDGILKHNKKILEKKKNNLSFEDLKNEASNKTEDNLFEENIENDDISFICEVKKASPSKGIICREFDPVKIAKEYESAGASAISVLTEPKFFKGSDNYLSSIVENVKIPVLRKDFIIDEYMIYESKLLGASALLLITSILDFNQLKNYIELSYELNISPLVETHTLNDIKIAIDAGAKVIGVNNRNLKDFTVDIKNTINLEKHIPKNIREKIVLVSESGIATPEDIKILNDNNIDAVLIGESLMKSKDKKIAIENLKSLI